MKIILPNKNFHTFESVCRLHPESIAQSSSGFYKKKHCIQLFFGAIQMFLQMFHKSMWKLLTLKAIFIT